MGSHNLETSQDIETRIFTISHLGYQDIATSQDVETHFLRNIQGASQDPATSQDLDMLLTNPISPPKSKI